MPALTILARKSFAFGMELSTDDAAQGVGTALAYKIDRMSSIIAGLGGAVHGGSIGARARRAGVVAPGEIGWAGSAPEAPPAPSAPAWPNKEKLPAAVRH